MPSDKGNETASGAYILEARNIVKLFGDLRANDDIDLSLKPGEIHALLGENGAGKSTLVKIIYGALQPTSGELFWNGSPVTISNPAAARDLGIGMVFQHFSLFDALTVTQNIALALKGERNMAALAGRIETVSADYGLPLRPGALVADLSVGERQRIEVVRCLLQEPRLLILDEPTAVLTPQEADQLFVTLERLAGEGCAVLYISHRLEEVKTPLPRRDDPAPWAPGGAGRSAAGIRRVARQAHDRHRCRSAPVRERRDDRRAPARARRPLHADRRPLRRCAEEHRSRGPVRGGRRDSGCRGQRPVGALRCHLGRADEQVRGCGEGWRARPAAARPSRRGAGAMPPSCRRSASVTLPFRSCRSRRTSFSPIMAWGKASCARA